MKETIIKNPDGSETIKIYSTYSDAQKRATAKYRSNNKEKVNEQRKKYYQTRKASDPHFLEYKRTKAKEYYYRKKSSKESKESESKEPEEPKQPIEEPIEEPKKVEFVEVPILDETKEEKKQRRGKKGDKGGKDAKPKK